MFARSLLACSLLAFLLWNASAHAAEKRVALIIGNGAYANAPALANPKNDAEDMAAALRKLGFTVILGLDLDKTTMDRKIRAFAKELSGADAGVFHYSGHGLQVAGVNYLVPVDAELATESALDFEAVRLDLIQRTMEREARTNIIFLDACRNNPFTRVLARSLGTRAVAGGGLAPAEVGRRHSHQLLDPARKCGGRWHGAHLAVLRSACKGDRQAGRGYPLGADGSQKRSARGDEREAGAVGEPRPAREVLFQSFRTGASGRVASACEGARSG